jgi:hypothetical protein
VANPHENELMDSRLQISELTPVDLYDGVPRKSYELLHVGI